ncbi:MAG: hypothetical protein KDB24_05880 [Microthrixaceae bacterium]|nr:hypothetical protein [Microthrixaceae bacterium]
MLPTTDAGAIGQVIGVTVLTVIATVVLRHHKELRWFAVGLGVQLLSILH